MNAPENASALRRSAGHRAAARTVRGCWSAPASTATSRRRARRSSRRAREIVTVAIRRTNIGQNAASRRCSTRCRPTEFTYLPNSAGCYTADDAVRTLKLARELLDGHALCKLEVLGDPTSLFPDVRETLKAAEQLVADGFQVMVYTSDDPIVARELEAIGCVAIMPLASLIGSGMGILNPWNLRLILEQAQRARARRRRRRHGVGRGDRDGARLRRRADEHGDRAGAGPGADGARDAARRRSGPRCVSRRPHAAQARTPASPSSPTSGLIA